MDTREEFLIRLASVLDGLGMEQGLKVKEQSVERAFGGTGAIAIAEAEAFARVHGCTFRYNRAMREGMFYRSYPPGGRA
ncbi:hypothetical protein [Bradyrhizobium sp. LTSP857]|uniref:hypothetical protein n=1 Tax=Bradyrhizobium sp. LTSP857 TaxID=1619231 RepID=UPI0005D1DD37|nr:hypothetical protein [Bradyrhizobium sp. LTSP857]KJC34404.1 hypothetical protein UP06_33245 [Bradyrhizobium sp. LTSP857]